jgi:putative DNA primase/helicase
MAKTNEPDTFADFATVMKAYAMGGYDGIGIRVASDIGAIDIDHCIREDGTLNDVAASVLGIFKDAYFERSPSGTGLRGFFKLDGSFVYDKTAYYINNRTHGLEVYLPGTTNRFVTVTGDKYRDGAVVLDIPALRSVLDTFMKRKSRVANNHIEPCSYLNDEQVLEHAMRSESGEKFKTLYDGHWEELYGSQSDADMAFVSMLAFWCGCVEEQIDRIFRSSGLMRDKWDRMTGEATYGQITIRNAVASAQAIYLPVNVNDMNDPDAEFENLDERKAEFRPDISRVTLTLEQMQPHTNPRYGRDEIGVGNAFADYFKPIARYDMDRGIWYVFDGAVWRPDRDSLAVAELAKLLADKLYMYAVQIKDEDARKRYIDRVKKLQQRRNRRTMVEDAKSVFPVQHKVFDRNNYLFNCKNGTLDLRTMEFRPHDPNDFLTLMGGISYIPEARCPRWEQFVTEVMCSDKKLAAYLQRALGYALTGDTSMECMFILYGATARNGKGTTMETFLKIMGDYGKTSNPELLAAKFGPSASSGNPTEDVARLAGARFVNISEPEKKITFNAALVKRLTGNDTITARFLHENSFEFTTTFKIFINTNYLPNVADMALFDSGRCISSRSSVILRKLSRIKT